MAGSEPVTVRLEEAERSELAADRPASPESPAPVRITGLEGGLAPNGTVRLVLEDGTSVSYLEYQWDEDSRVADLGNAETAEGHRERGYATRLLAALVDAAPNGSVLRAVGLHSPDGLRWMAGARERGYRIHQSFWCFKNDDRCVGPNHPDPCPVGSNDRIAWAAS
jgi:hypothetical protein